MDSPAMRDLAHLIASWQNENGGWFFSSLFTMINAIALTQCGYTATDGVIGRAHRYVRSTFLPKPGAGAGIGFATPDVWDTTSGILAYLEQPGHRAADPEIRQSINFLNAASAPDGGYGWGSGSSNDTDTDSTAYALRALALASATADERLRKALRSTLDGGLRYVTARQDRRGGFSVWHPCLVPAPSRAMGFRAQQVFDLATADTTARVLTGLAASGLTWKDRTVRRAVTDLVRLQHHNGGWWCRWCAGYIAGTSYVLEAMAEVGIRPDRSSDGADRERAAARRAVRRGIGFLVSRQNGDGGWGETVMADFSQRFAGVGASRALHTAYALLALIRCGDSVTSEPVVRGIEWLVAHQDERTGEWGGGDAVFTLFARTWYYRYPFYDLFMPLRALNAYLSPPE
jgi:squalene-hopene/tetraprenyl-beta-curcumene cyclase